MNIPTATCFLFTFLWLFGYTTLVHSQGAPKFIGRPKKKYNASERSSVRLRCPVTGTNDPHNRTLVAWTRNSKHISNTNPVWSRFRVKVGRYLKIVNISRQDAGVYTCKAFNEFGSIMLKIRLSVYDRKNEGKTGGEPPRFKGRPPRDLDFKTGETAKLRCHSTGNPDPEVQWYKDGQSYTKNKRQSVSANGWTLNLRYLTKRDSGTYLCRVSNKLGTITRTFIVKVKARIPKPRVVNTEHNVSVHQGAPKFIGRPKKKYNASERSSVRLRCPVTGTNDPPHNRTLVAWTRNSKHISNTNPVWSRFRVKVGRYLKIVNISRQDAGVYTCKAFNEFGSIMLKIRLSVYDRKNEGKTGGEPPRFKGRPPRDLDFKTGETAKLRCHSTGNPDPEVQWYKDGQSYTKNKRQSVSANGWTLNLRYLTKRDSGTYLCRVSNKLGTITRTFIVKVKARIPKPRIVNTEHNVSVHQGKNATLDCRATSTGKPVFTWRRWGNTFNKFNRSKKIRVSKKISTKYVIYEIKHNEMDMFGTSLVIINATKEDEGNYTCVVKNKYGSDEMVKFLFVLMRGDGPGLITTTLRPTPGKSQDAEKKDSFALVIGLTASTVVTIALIVLSILCCRKQRKNLEEQYVRACKPVSLLQPQQKICVSREMQKPSCQEHVPPRDSSWHKSYSEPSDNTSRTFHDNYDRLDEGVTSSNETQRPKYGLQADNYPEQRTERRSSNPDYSNAVDSRTSSETTIATETSGSREPFIDFKKSTNSIPDCRPAESHSNYGGINSYKDHRNSSGSENQFVRETVM